MIVQNASRRTVLSAEWCCRVDRVDRASSLELHLNLASSSSSSSIGQHLPNFFQRISSVRKGKQNARICLPNSQCEFHTARISLCHGLCTSAARDLWLSLIALFSMQFELFRKFRRLSPNFLCIQKFAAVRLGPLVKPLADWVILKVSHQLATRVGRLCCQIQELTSQINRSVREIKKNENEILFKHSIKKQMTKRKLNWIKVSLSHSPSNTERALRLFFQEILVGNPRTCRLPWYKPENKLEHSKND